MINIIYFGTQGAFSRPPLERLLAAGLLVKAVIVPTASARPPERPRRLEPVPPAASDLPLVDPYLSPTILHLAWAHNIPVWEVGSVSDAPTLGLLADFQPDVIVVACFPFVLPPALLRLPRYGCLNLHPSLLPAYRGPTPLFWMARRGERQAGVTLHLMDEGLDSGDIVAQTAFEWPDGIAGPALEQRCAVEGGRLLQRAIQHLVETGYVPASPQPTQGSSYFSWPAAEDLVIPTTWDARRAFNFARVAAEWPLVIEVAPADPAAPLKSRFLIQSAVAYKATPRLGQPFLLQSDTLWVQFDPGVLQVKIRQPV